MDGIAHPVRLSVDIVCRCTKDPLHSGFLAGKPWAGHHRARRRRRRPPARDSNSQPSRCLHRACPQHRRGPRRKRCRVRHRGHIGPRPNCSGNPQCTVRRALGLWNRRCPVQSRFRSGCHRHGRGHRPNPRCNSTIPAGIGHREHRPVRKRWHHRREHNLPRQSTGAHRDRAHRRPCQTARACGKANRRGRTPIRDHTGLKTDPAIDRGCLRGQVRCTRHPNTGFHRCNARVRARPHRPETAT